MSVAVSAVDQSVISDYWIGFGACAVLLVIVAVVSVPLARAEIIIARDRRREQRAARDALVDFAEQGITPRLPELEPHTDAVEPSTVPITIIPKKISRRRK